MAHTIPQFLLQVHSNYDSNLVAALTQYVANPVDISALNTGVRLTIFITYDFCNELLDNLTLEITFPLDSPLSKLRSIVCKHFNVREYTKCGSFDDDFAPGLCFLEVPEQEHWRLKTPFDGDYSWAWDIYVKGSCRRLSSDKSLAEQGITKPAFLVAQIVAYDGGCSAFQYTLELSKAEADALVKKHKHIVHQERSTEFKPITNCIMSQFTFISRIQQMPHATMN